MRASVALWASVIVGDLTHIANAGLVHQLEEFETLGSLREILGGSGRALRTSEDQTVLAFNAFGERHSIKLERVNTLFKKGYRHVVLNHNFQGQELLEEDVDCIYKGEGSIVSFCNNFLYGKIFSPILNETIHIEPHDSDIGKHVVFKARSLLESEESKSPGLCGINVKNIPDMYAGGNESYYNLEDRLKNLVNITEGKEEGSTRYIELLLLNDHARFEQHGATKVHAHSAFVVSLVNEVFASLPGQNSVQILLTGMYTFSENDAWQNTFSKTKTKSVEVGTLLTGVATWAEDNLAVLPDHDLVHALSGFDFYSSQQNSDEVIGLAWVGGWCVQGKNAGVTQATFASTQYVAITMTHEIMHGLGAEHTDTDPPYSHKTCYNAKEPHIMDPVSRVLDPAWSGCSEEWLRSQINLGYGKCTAKYPAKIWSSKPTCGDGLVEGDEECDCPLMTNCDPCCDVNTCKLKETSSCSANDPCCNPSSCAIRTVEENFVCRPALNSECDQEEVCDGTSRTCPYNKVTSGGTRCTSTTYGVGACYFGECNIRKEQCAKRGFSFACASDCGSLKCSKTEAGTCFDLSPYLVEDGTPCDSGVCYQGQCLDSSKLPSPEDYVSCANGLRDNNESDVDCGGPLCPKCYAGQKCQSSSDCIYPSYCNTSDNLCHDLIGSGLSETNNSVLSWDSIKEWITSNVSASIGIGVCLLVLIIVSIICCCDCCGKSKKRRRPVEKYRVNGKVVSPVYVAEEQFRRSLRLSSSSNDSRGNRQSLPAGNRNSMPRPLSNQFGRPMSGQFPRPTSGQISRPISGQVSRPVSGQVSRMTSDRRDSARQSLPIRVSNGQNRSDSLSDELSLYVSGEIPMAIPIGEGASRKSLRMSSVARNRLSSRLESEAVHRRLSNLSESTGEADDAEHNDDEDAESESSGARVKPINGEEEDGRISESFTESMSDVLASSQSSASQRSSRSSRVSRSSKPSRDSKTSRDSRRSHRTNSSESSFQFEEEDYH